MVPLQSKECALKKWKNWVGRMDIRKHTEVLLSQLIGNDDCAVLDTDI